MIENVIFSAMKEGFKPGELAVFSVLKSREPTCGTFYPHPSPNGWPFPTWKEYPYNYQKSAEDTIEFKVGEAPL
jgi:hypothetical protein